MESRDTAPDERSTESDDLPGLSGPALWAHWNAGQGDPYALDSVERFLEDGAGRPRCSEDMMMPYGGTHVRYYGPVRVNASFRDRLVLFEQIVSEVATEFYGRAPRRLRHLGAYSCRVSRNRSHRLSEHALGNAIDVLGFDFGAASKDSPLGADAPAELRHAFQVRVARHWKGGASRAASIHASFLQELARRVVERGDVFRVAIGPNHRGHHDHLHFDMSPWRYTDL